MEFKALAQYPNHHQLVSQPKPLEHSKQLISWYVKNKDKRIQRKGIHEWKRRDNIINYTRAELHSKSYKVVWRKTKIDISPAIWSKGFVEKLPSEGISENIFSQFLLWGSGTQSPCAIPITSFRSLNLKYGSRLGLLIEITKPKGTLPRKFILKVYSIGNRNIQDSKTKTQKFQMHKTNNNCRSKKKKN